MGNYFGFLRGPHESGVEMLEPVTYRYPPKSGKYFASHYYMAGERFKTMNEECFLFGENADLNYLSSKPCAFPYAPPVDGQPCAAIRSLVHLRKDSLKLNKVESEDSDEKLQEYFIEFIFDADIACAVRIFLFASEDNSGGSAKYKSPHEEYVSEPMMFEKGADQVFSTSKFQFSPYQLHFDNECTYSPGDPVIPVVIQITVEDPEFIGQSESTFATLDKLSDDSYNIKFLKQKIVVAGFSYIMQEIYGIENKKAETPAVSDDDYFDDDDNTECVICMGNFRDTLILPCRHLCLCNECAEKMKTEQSKCPMCRAHFYALLQVKAMRRKPSTNQKLPMASSTNQNESDELEEIPLVEALNGYLPLDEVTPESARNSRRSWSARSGRHSQKGSRRSLRSSARANKREKDKTVICSATPEDSKHSLVSSETAAITEADTHSAVEIADESHNLESVIDNELPRGSQDDMSEASTLSSSLSSSGTRISTKALIVTPNRISESRPPPTVSITQSIGDSGRNNKLERSLSVDNAEELRHGGVTTKRPKTSRPRLDQSVTSISEQSIPLALDVSTSEIADRSSDATELAYLTSMARRSNGYELASMLGSSGEGTSTGIVGKSDVDIEMNSLAHVGHDSVEEIGTSNDLQEDTTPASLVTDSTSDEEVVDDSLEDPHMDHSLPGTPLETSSTSSSTVTSITRRSSTMSRP